MNADLPHDHLNDSEMDPSDPLWELLGHAPLREPDGWFAARTLARCRHTRLVMEPGWAVFGQLWRRALGGGVGASLAIALVATQIRSESAAHVQQKNVQAAFEIVASLGTDSDSSSTTGSSSWQDSAL
jgi:hypothetical protein